MHCRTVSVPAVSAAKCSDRPTRVFYADTHLRIVEDQAVVSGCSRNVLHRRILQGPTAAAPTYETLVRERLNHMQPGAVPRERILEMFTQH